MQRVSSRMIACLCFLCCPVWQISAFWCFVIAKNHQRQLQLQEHRKTFAHRFTRACVWRDTPHLIVNLLTALYCCRQQGEQAVRARLWVGVQVGQGLLAFWLDVGQGPIRTLKGKNTPGTNKCCGNREREEKKNYRKFASPILSRHCLNPFLKLHSDHLFPEEIPTWY